MIVSLLPISLSRPLSWRDCTDFQYKSQSAASSLFRRQKTRCLAGPYDILWQGEPRDVGIVAAASQEALHQARPKSLDDALAWLTARLNGPRRAKQPGEAL
jgi:hypothetical protein